MVTLQLLGSVKLTDELGRDLGHLLGRPKRFALLAYLAANTPQRFHRRDRLLCMFWPELTTDQARHGLRQALYELRKALGADIVTGRGDEVGVNETCIKCDVAQLSQALERSDYNEVAELDQGEFLDAFFVKGAPEVEEWIERRRAELRGLILDACTNQADSREAAGDIEGAVRAARHAVRKSPTDEVIGRRLIRLLMREGNTGAALHAYKVLARSLEKEFDATPSKETTDLIGAVRATNGAPESHKDLAARSLSLSDLSTKRSAEPEIVYSPTQQAHVANVAGEIVPARVTSRLLAKLRPQAIAILIGFIVVAATGFIVWKPFDTFPTASMVVLPFANLTEGESDESFRTGLHDDLLTRLTGLEDLSVPARTTIARYDNTALTPSEIANALRVRYALVGTFRRSDSTVRVNVRLIDSENDRQVWADQFDGDLRASDIFAIQSDIVTRVASKLKLRFSPAEKTAVGVLPTDNYDAWQAYTVGLVNAVYVGEAENRVTIRSFERAVELDPEFALAWARLAHARTYRFTRYWGDSQDSIRAWDAINRATQLAPDDPIIQYRLGSMIASGEERVRLRKLALAKRPNDVEMLYGIGVAYKRLIHFDSAEVYFKRALQNDPANGVARGELAVVYRWAGRFHEAARTMDSAIADVPDYLGFYSARLTIYQSLGDTATIRQLTGENGFGLPAWAYVKWRRFLLLAERRYDDVIALLLTEPSLDRFEEGNTYRLALATAYRLRGDTAVSRVHADSARLHLENELRRIDRDGAHPISRTRVQGALASAYALLGRDNEAIQLAEQTVEAMRPIGPSWVLARLFHLPNVYTWTGHTEDAVAALRRLLSGQGIQKIYTVDWMMLDPIYDELHGLEGFKALVEEFRSTTTHVQ